MGDFKSETPMTRFCLPVSIGNNIFQQWILSTTDDLGSARVKPCSGRSSGSTKLGRSAALFTGCFKSLNINRVVSCSHPIWSQNALRVIGFIASPGRPPVACTSTISIRSCPKTHRTDWRSFRQISHLPRNSSSDSPTILSTVVSLASSTTSSPSFRRFTTSITGRCFCGIIMSMKFHDPACDCDHCAQPRRHSGPLTLNIALHGALLSSRPVVSVVSASALR